MGWPDKTDAIIIDKNQTVEEQIHDVIHETVEESEIRQGLSYHDAHVIALKAEETIKTPEQLVERVEKIKKSEDGVKMATKSTKKPNAMTKHFDQVIWFGGFPMRRGNVYAYLEEVAKSTGEKNWLAIRDAGMMGSYQYNEKHGYPPEGTEPISLADFKKIVEHEPSSKEYEGSVKIADVVTASEASQAGEELSEYGHQKKAKYKVTSRKSHTTSKRHPTSTGLGSAR